MLARTVLWIRWPLPSTGPSHPGRRPWLLTQNLGTCCRFAVRPLEGEGCDFGCGLPLPPQILRPGGETAHVLASSPPAQSDYGGHLGEEAQASRKTDPEPAEWREESCVLSHSLLVPPCDQPLYYLQVRACQGPTAGSPPLFSGDKSPLPSYLRTTWRPPVLTSQKRASLHKKSALLDLS